jgi:hypothetical protein
MCTRNTCQSNLNHPVLYRPSNKRESPTRLTGSARGSLTLPALPFYLTQSNEIRYFVFNMAAGNLKQLRSLLDRLADADHYLFGLDDLAPVFPELSRSALKMLLSRAVADDLLEHPCREVYLYPRAPYPRGYTLCHIAAKLRADTFNYISLETALSDAGVISQVPLQWLTVISGGRSAVIQCGRFGSIEFIHTTRRPQKIAPDVQFDPKCRLWRAIVPLALADMKRCKRSLDLIDWSSIDELV